MVSPTQMQDTDGDGEGDESSPQIGSVGFIIGTRSLCVYTPFGWIDVEVCRITSLLSIVHRLVCFYVYTPYRVETHQ